MSNLGKRIRMKRLMGGPGGTSIIFAIDHGMTSPVFLDPLIHTKDLVKQAIGGGANVVMMGRNFAKMVVPETFKEETSLALLLSASAARCTNGNRVVPIAQVEEALRLGADAVVVYVSLQGKYDAEMIKFVGEVGEACEKMGMPFIAEAEYPSAYMPSQQQSDEYGEEYLIYNARLCAELGADIVKSNWTGDVISFRKLIKAASVPVVVAGGHVVEDEQFFGMIAQAKEAGAKGCSVGRNIFQHRNPKAITKAICEVFRGRKPIEEILSELKNA